MTETIVAAARDRISLSDIGGAVAIAVVCYALGYDETALATLLGLLVGVPVVGAVFDAISVGSTSAGVAFGVFVAVAGTSVALDGGLRLPLGVVLVAVGCWLILDTLYEYRHGEPTDSASAEDDLSMAEMQALGTHGRWVLEALREADRPLTAGEIRTRTGLTEDELADVLEILEGNGTVEPMGTGYVIDESAMGLTGFVRSIGGRLLRPIRLFGPS